MGFSYFRHPEYLYQTTTGLFVFRLRVPEDCKVVIPEVVDLSRHDRKHFNLITGVSFCKLVSVQK